MGVATGTVPFVGDDDLATEITEVVTVRIGVGELWCKGCGESLAVGMDECPRCGGTDWVDPLAGLLDRRQVVVAS